MKRALMYASVASMIQQFNMNNIKILQNLDYQVDVVCNFRFGNTISEEKIKKFKNDLDRMHINYYHIPIPRKITDINNLKESFRLTKKIINDNKYNLIHCHSPIGGIICRLANKKSRNYGYVKMIYTAHGFHFFKGNNIIKNFIFKAIEKYSAKYTDILITINKEDYLAAKQFTLKKNGEVLYIPGVGIDLENIQNIEGDRNDLLKKLRLDRDVKLLLSVGELSKRKNQISVIKSIPYLNEKYHYVLCGIGNKYSEFQDLAKQLNIENRIHMLGYRTDIIKIMKSCDIFLFPSLQEGLPVALMEAMACGLPCIASKIRGNTDLIQKDGGFLITINSFSKELIKILNEDFINESMGIYNSNAIKSFSLKFIEKSMIEIYKGDECEV